MYNTVEQEPTEVKKRTYDQQKDTIKKYLKNRWANDEDFRRRETENKRINQRIRYNDDEEYRKKILQNMKDKRTETKQLEINNTIKDFESKMESVYKGIINTDDIKLINNILIKIKKYKPDYIYSRRETDPIN
jgi:hypothetical protein